METLLINWYHNYKGGINNLYVVQVRNLRQEVIKSFKSTISMETATKRAKRFQNKLKKETSSVTH